ncbi:MAG TPA: pseudouridine synthase [Steroidobacteraceae bacterium]|nr:pseudouridine synthase [Steroidobacteraceae bacterium]
MREKLMRLQKLLAAAGLGSRRHIEEWIRDGRLTLNGRLARLGDQAGPGDEVRLDGSRLQLDAPVPGAHQLLLYHKPVGEVTTRQDPQARPTVFERLPPPRNGRWVSVGRLDVNTTGLLLFTTDGALAHRLMHPSAEVEREYQVRVHGTLSAQALRALTTGVKLEDGPARFERVEPLPSTQQRSAHQHWYRVVLREGRNREVRRLWAAVGCEVSRLRRTRYGPLELPAELRPGTWRLGSAAELAALEQVSRAAPSG